MKPRRWPDVVIVVAIVAIGAFGAWALWGEELGLHGDDAGERPGETGGATGAT